MTGVWRGRSLVRSNYVTRGFHPMSVFLHSMCKTYHRLDVQLVVANDTGHQGSTKGMVEDLRSFRVLGGINHLY